ncbi:MAG: hypothetical protein IPO21_09360 [Bacteroidales bacterium]|nr:hypothetical protein [Bacteroidales bacterium]
MSQKIDYFKDYDNGEIFLKILKITFVFYHRIFDEPYHALKKELPLDIIENIEINDYLTKLYLYKAYSLYNYEGYTIEFVKYLIKNDYRNDNAVFYLGNFNFIDDDKDFYTFERDLNKNQLNIRELKLYIEDIYEKQHLEKLQSTYILSKIERVEFETIQKLVVTNPYSKGLKTLMFAFIEEDKNNKILLYEDALEDLEHIKYYYIEAIYFYIKFLKSINHKDYQIWFNKGFELADRFYYRFHKHRFICLKENTEKLYIEKDYPLPDELDLDTYVQKKNDSMIELDENNK